MIFSVDTTLYHPVEGKKLFPQGEQHPGPMWSARPGGEPVGAQTNVQALKDLTEAEDRIEALEGQLVRQSASMDVLAAERDKAVAELGDMEQAKIAAEGAAEEAKSQAESLTKERDRAVQEAEALRAKIAPLDGDKDGEPGGSKPEADDPEADEKAALRAELEMLGQPSPHHKTGVAKLRELVAAAKG